MRKLCLAVIAFCLCSFAQQPSQQPSIEGKTSGDCSPNILANSGGVQFVCKTAVDEATSKRIVSLLNQILRKDNKDSAASNEINRKLDEILDFLKNASRHLSDDDKAGIVAHLTGFHAKVDFGVVAGVADGWQYAYELRNALREAKVDVGDIRLVAPIGGGPPLYGIELIARGEAPPGSPIPFESQAGILGSALNAGHVDITSAHLDPNFEADRVKVIVGFNGGGRR
jgi:hypothetical protein